MASKKNINLSGSKLFSNQTVETPVEETSLYEEAKELRDSASKRPGHPRREDLVRDVPAQSGLTKEYTRATYILPVDMVDYIQDLAYTERVRIQDGIMMLLEIGKKEIEKQYKKQGKELLHKTR